MPSYIVHSSIDENRKARGGAAGDQTGKEVCTRTWYSKPWGMVLRCPDAKIAETAREIAIKLANSNLVGYDQNNRNSLYKELKKNNWDVDAYIKSGVKTETDCSSFVYAVYCCLIPEMRSDANAPTTSASQSFYKKHGFKVLTDDKYTKSAANLKRGDLLNKAGSHIVMYCGTDVNVASSVKVIPPVAAYSPNLKKGSKGTQVRYLQQDLNYIMGCNLDVDGDFGAKTLAALKSFQKKYGLKVDGIYGVNSNAKMRELLYSTNEVVTAKVTAKSGLRMRKANGSAIKTIPYDKTVTVEQKNAMTMNIGNVNYIMTKVKCDEVTGYVAQKYLKF